MLNISIICKAHLTVPNWTSLLGPVDDWPKVFHDKYNEVCYETSSQTTQDSIDVFLRQVIEHVWVGKSILKAVEECPSIKFPFSSHNKADILLAGDLMHTLHQVIAILEAQSTHPLGLKILFYFLIFVVTMNYWIISSTM